MRGRHLEHPTHHPASWQRERNCHSQLYWLHKQGHHPSGGPRLQEIGQGSHWIPRTQNHKTTEKIITPRRPAKRWHSTYWRWGNTQKNNYNIQITAKAWNLQLPHVCSFSDSVQLPAGLIIAYARLSWGNACAASFCEIRLKACFLFYHSWCPRSDAVNHYTPLAACNSKVSVSSDCS
jgi:hypothetical protein